MSRKMKSVSEIQLHSVPVARSFYPSATHDRFVAALIVGYDDTDDDAGVKSAQEAAALACSLVHEGGTIWTVLDRQTGLWHQWEDAGQERKAPPAPAPETTWRCSVCGGANVQRAVWTNPNTGETGEGVLDGRATTSGHRWRQIMNKFRFEIAAVVRFTVYAETEEQARLHAATLVDCAVPEELPVEFEALTEADDLVQSYDGVCEPDATAELKILYVEENKDEPEEQPERQGEP